MTVSESELKVLRARLKREEDFNKQMDEKRELKKKIFLARNRTLTRFGKRAVSFGKGTQKALEHFTFGSEKTTQMARPRPKRKIRAIAIAPLHIKKKGKRKRAKVIGSTLFLDPVL